MTALLKGHKWTHSTATNIRDTMRAFGFVPPEEMAKIDERAASIEGALIAMKRIQAEQEEA